MDNVLSLFGKSMKEMGKSPVLLAAGFAVGVLSLPLLAGYGDIGETVRSLAVDFSQLFVPLLVLPFIGGGAIGYAVEVREKGSSGLSAFVASGVKHYPRMIMGGVIAFIVYYFLTAGSVLFALVGIMADPFLGSALGFIAMALAFFILMAIEFYDAAIVARGLGVIAAFRDSVDFARKNLATVAVFFLIVLVLKALVQVPLSFGLAGAMMANETYYSALMAASNSSLANGTAVNGTLDLASLMTADTVRLGAGALATVGVFQVLVQGFVYALLTLFKVEVYLTTTSRKKITDFDYDFSDEKTA